MKGPLVIVGDVLLDVDLVGRAGRLSPDAPVPVLDDVRESARPGGAGLAALMAARDGREVVLVTAIGDDDAGRRLRELLTARPGLELHTVPYDGPTAVKQRVRAQGQSLLRIDRGTAAGRHGTVPEAAARAVRAAGAVLVADYGRGITGLAGLRGILGSLSTGVPVTWDPHPRGSVPLRGARLVTPNESEAAAFARPIDEGLTGDDAWALVVRAGRHADALVHGWRVQAVAVTVGARGAVLSYGDGVPAVHPAPPATCVDPCGAGDRFAVSAATALAGGALTSEAVQLAVADATAYVASGGPASLERPVAPGGRTPSGAREALEARRLPQQTEPTEPPELVGPAQGQVAATTRAPTRRHGVVVATGGCFDLLHAGHVATLRAARELGDYLVVLVNSDASVRRLKGPTRPLVPVADRVRVLEALECVDEVVVFEEDTPARALRRIRPHLWAKGGDYAGRDVPEAAVMGEWGGQAVVLPYLTGRSTTSLVATARESDPARQSRRSGSGRPPGPRAPGVGEVRR